MHHRYKELLHHYKRDVFLLAHHQKDVDSVTKECMHVRDDLLTQKYHYHFHGLADANRAEIINMINNYTREALLPPIVEKLVQRQVLLERHVAALEQLLARTLELLSDSGSPAPASSH